MYTYEYKPGSRVRGVDAQTAGERLEALRERYGVIMPEAVVEDARPEDAPLHPAFEWDDAVAAEEHRRTQARALIRSVAVRYTDNSESRPVRAFVNVHISDGDAYTSTVVALSDEALRRQVLVRALKELRAWEAKYQDLQELAEVFAAAGSVREAVAAD